MLLLKWHRLLIIQLLVGMRIWSGPFSLREMQKPSCRARYAHIKSRTSGHGMKNPGVYLLWLRHTDCWLEQSQAGKTILIRGRVLLTLCPRARSGAQYGKHQSHLRCVCSFGDWHDTLFRQLKFCTGATCQLRLRVSYVDSGIHGNMPYYNAQYLEAPGLYLQKRFLISLALFMRMERRSGCSLCWRL